MENINRLENLLSEIKGLSFTHIDKVIFTSPKKILNSKKLINPKMRQNLKRHEKAVDIPFYPIYKVVKDGEKGSDINICMHGGENLTSLGELLIKHQQVETHILWDGIKGDRGITLKRINTKEGEVFDSKKIQKYRKKGYLILKSHFPDKKFGNLKGGDIKNELKHIKLTLNAEEDIPIEDQLRGLIEDCIDKGHFITDDIEEIARHFKITEIELNSFYTNKEIFDILYNSVPSNWYDTLSYLWTSKKDSELYTYNITAKNEKRNYCKEGDIFKIEVRMKSDYLDGLKRKNPKLKSMSYDELSRWLLDFINNNKDKKDSLSKKVFRKVVRPFVIELGTVRQRELLRKAIRRRTPEELKNIKRRKKGKIKRKRKEVKTI